MPPWHDASVRTSGVRRAALLVGIAACTGCYQGHTGAADGESGGSDESAGDGDGPVQNFGAFGEPGEFDILEA